MPIKGEWEKALYKVSCHVCTTLSSSMTVFRHVLLPFQQLLCRLQSWDWRGIASAGLISVWPTIFSIIFKILSISKNSSLLMEFGLRILTMPLRHLFRKTWMLCTTVFVTFPVSHRCNSTAKQLVLKICSLRFHEIWINSASWN